jgi:hypothetical protein
MTNNKFKNKFLKILREAPELEVDPTLERDAAEASLDDDVSMDDYDVDMEPDPNAGVHFEDPTAQQNEQMISIIDTWYAKISEFGGYINGDQPNSLLNILANANSESILGNFKSKHYNEISRIASDIGALKEALLAAKKNK